MKFVDGLFVSRLQNLLLQVLSKSVQNSSTEMTWETFGGPYHGTYTALLRYRCQKDGLGTEKDTLAQQFRLHLHRGLSYLASDKNLQSISNLF